MYFWKPLVDVVQYFPDQLPLITHPKIQTSSFSLQIVKLSLNIIHDIDSLSPIYLYEGHFTYSAKAFPCTPRLNLKVSSCQCRHAYYQLTILLPALPQLSGPVSIREQAVTSLWWQTQLGTKAPHLQYMVRVIQSLIFFFSSQVAQIRSVTWWCKQE